MKKLIFLTLLLSVALLFVSCQGDIDTKTEATANNEETSIETTETTQMSEETSSVESTSNSEEASSVESTSNAEETSSVEDISNTEETTLTQETENNEPYEIKADDYTLIKNENGCYLTFDDISKYQNNSNGGSVLADVVFKSIKDFKDSVTQGLLTDDDKYIVASFPKNTDGSIKTCDFNNLYEPILPQGSSITKVLWESDNYSFRIIEEDVYYGYFNIFTAEDYMRIYQDEYENALNKDTITITETEEADGKVIIHYKTKAAKLKLERYTLQSGDKTIIIDKKFIITGDPILNPSDTVPSNIRLYCNEGDKYYIINIDTVYEDPTDEWLLEFGLKPYIENDHEVM